MYIDVCYKLNNTRNLPKYYMNVYLDVSMGWGDRFESYA